MSPWTTIYTEVVISRVRSKFELARYSEFVDGFGPLFSNQPRLNGRREGGTSARHVWKRMPRSARGRRADLAAQA